MSTRTVMDNLVNLHAHSRAAIESGPTRLSRSALADRAERLGVRLRRAGVSGLAIYLDNGIDWIVADLACQCARIRSIPVPLFFSPAQIRHALATAGVDAVLADDSNIDSLHGAEPDPAFDGDFNGPRLWRMAPSQSPQLPPGSQKITFTSGTTGAPKGVCLSSSQQLELARSLASVIDIMEPTHLCLLPLSTLLENLAGVYSPLIAGGTVLVPPLADVGLGGSSTLDVPTLLDCIDRNRPDSVILVPEMLNALCLAASAGWRPPTSLRFVAVGGGKVAPDLLRRARAAGIPAYEGYGLTECGSVVSLNLPAADRIGSAGRPLPHVAVTTVNREIVVSGNTFLGYAAQPESWGMEFVKTGDLGHVDEDGFVHVDGRKKHQLITSFGRNLSPEWVESELLLEPSLQQAVVIGDDRPYCVALLYPRDASASDREIEACIDRANRRLPDYARIASWFRLSQALGTEDGTLTENGRPRRDVIEKNYAAVVEGLYPNLQKASNL